MSKLCVWLAPFSPDYSGVSSVFFDLNTVTAMHDASGCTGNYTGYDEPRWYGSKSGIFCSGLREVDAVLGDDEKLMKRMLSAKESLNPDMLVAIGSPVPMVIGSDMVGIAHELEERSNLPCFGFDTTGTAYYDFGVSQALLALTDKFMDPLETKEKTVNILGATPLDFGISQNIPFLKDFLEQNDYSVTATMAMGYTLDDIKQASSAALNIVVARSGVETAIEMQKRFGIPYIVGLPIGEKSMNGFLKNMEQVIDTKTNKIIKGTNSENTGKILILGEQVISNSMRQALEQEFGLTDIVVGSIFGLDSSLALSQDKNLKDEMAIKKELNADHYEMVIADPSFDVLFEDNYTKKFLPIAHYSISSKLTLDQTVNYIGVHWNQWMASF